MCVCSVSAGSALQNNIAPEKSQEEKARSALKAHGGRIQPGPGVRQASPGKC